MKVSILGGGAWGSTLGQTLADNGHDVLIYDLVQERVDMINNEHKHPFFEDVKFLDNVKATTDLNKALDFASYYVLAVPSHATRGLLRQINPLIKEKKVFINVAKGIEPKTLLTISGIFKEEIDKDKVLGFVTLSGPSHAEEVIKRKLTLLVAASKNEEVAKDVQKLFSNQEYIRVYTTKDIIGVEVGGSVKNAIALVSGISTGLGLGENARAALISRGMYEVVALTLAMGGKKDTVFGLSGIGDLIVTASSMNSRNFQAGLKIGSGMTLDQAVASSVQVVEGARAIVSCYEIAKKYHLELPIIQTAYAVLYEGKNVNEGLSLLMKRELKAE